LCNAFCAFWEGLHAFDRKQVVTDLEKKENNRSSMSRTKGKSLWNDAHRFSLCRVLCLRASTRELLARTAGCIGRRKGRQLPLFSASP